MKDLEKSMWNIRREMYEQKMTQQELAERTGLSLAGISMMLHRGNMNLKSLYLIADALGMSMKSLFE